MADVFSTGYGNGRDEGDPPRAVDMLQPFFDHLVDRNVLTGDAPARFKHAKGPGTDKPLQRLWQLSETSAHEFADEVANFFALPRIGLADLMSATSLAERFSERFLREFVRFSMRGRGRTSSACRR